MRTYLSVNRVEQNLLDPAPLDIPQTLGPIAVIPPAADAGSDLLPPGFRFFDNRQKYQLFVSTCSEKADVAARISLELANIHPSPPALRVFDAGVGDGTVLARVMRALHARYPTLPLYVVAKEISWEDVRLTLDKMPDRLFEHPATVLVLTNLYYAEAPWLTPRSPTAAQGMIWKDVALTGNTSHGFAEQIAELEGFLSENWRAGISRKTGNPAYVRPIVLTLHRDDHTFLLDPILPRPGRVTADFDLVIASQPYRARASAEFKAAKVIAPLARALRPGGRLVGVHSYGHDPGLEVIRRSGPTRTPSPSTATPSSSIPSRSSARPRRTTISTRSPTPVRCFAITCTRCPTRCRGRSARPPFSRPGTRRSTSRRSRTRGFPRRSGTAATWRRRTAS